MKLASFQVQTPVGRFSRIGSVQGDGSIIDLSSAYASLKVREGEPQPHRLVEALVPPDMKRFIEAGSTALHEAHRAVEFVLQEGKDTQGPQGESLVFALTRIHRRTALGTALEEARGCSSESEIMVL